MKQSQKQKDFQLRLVEEREGLGREKVKETLAGLVCGPRNMRGW